ncbi:hypothetical protein ESOMN_v1c07090 [Williamsoniiplasma somnilux]|uniref:Transmembrane protein n=1 Tax=Williamsoniiplasma somnilux TaxID=215578 RepID=A0A2K8P253_9MOLU|nr:hypothetical protein ESOMN_v1c07090 [Williamsoniiplasma somnilux]
MKNSLKNIFGFTLNIIFLSILIWSLTWTLKAKIELKEHLTIMYFQNFYKYIMNFDYSFLIFNLLSFWFSSLILLKQIRIKNKNTFVTIFLILLGILLIGLCVFELKNFLNNFENIVGNELNNIKEFYSYLVSYLSLISVLILWEVLVMFIFKKNRV